jgi:hypothetical protein
MILVQRIRSTTLVNPGHALKGTIGLPGMWYKERERERS